MSARPGRGEYTARPTVLHFIDAQVTLDVGPGDDEEEAKKQQQDKKQALA
jgi:hypothetical protein